MSLHQKITWILRCKDCKAETDLGVRPAHMSPYKCRSCGTPEIFYYPTTSGPPETTTIVASESIAVIAQSTAKTRNFLFRRDWWEGVFGNIVAPIIIFLIVVSVLAFFSWKPVMTMLSNEIMHRIKEGKAADPLETINE